jgi:hypothetical protein
MRSNAYPSRFRLKIVITISVGVVSTLIAGTSIYFHLKREDLRDVLGFSAAALATAAAVTGASHIAQDLKHNAESARIDRTFSYIQRWNDPGFAKQSVIGLMREMRSLNDEEKREHLLRRLKDEDSLKSELVCIFNFLEEMALGISEGVVDEQILKDFFRGIVVIYIDTFRPWLKQRATETGRDLVYTRFMGLYKTWEGNGVPS